MTSRLSPCTTALSLRGSPCDRTACRVNPGGASAPAICRLGADGIGANLSPIPSGRTKLRDQIGPDDQLHRGAQRLVAFEELLELCLRPRDQSRVLGDDDVG